MESHLQAVLYDFFYRHTVDSDIGIIQCVDGNAPVVEHLGGRELKGHFVGVDAGEVDVQLVGFFVDEAVPRVDVAVVKAAAGQRHTVASGEQRPLLGHHLTVHAQNNAVRRQKERVNIRLRQIHRVGGHFGRRLLLDAVDGLDAADQDAIQPVIVQVVTVPRQLVLVDEA